MLSHAHVIVHVGTFTTPHMLLFCIYHVTSIKGLDAYESEIEQSRTGPPRFDTLNSDVHCIGNIYSRMELLCALCVMQKLSSCKMQARSCIAVHNLSQPCCHIHVDRGQGAAERLEGFFCKLCLPKDEICFLCCGKQGATGSV